MKYIGKSAPINDAQVKICGQVKFTGDMYLPGMLYAKIVKSTVANGLITGFDFHGADQLAGVVKIYTKSDCNLPKYNSYRTFPGQEFCPEDEELLTDHPRYAGDRVALVIATTAQIAAVAASMIEVQYERLPFAVSMAESLDPEMVAIHEDGNIVGEYRRSFGYGMAALSADILTRQITTEINTGKVHHGAIEPHVCLADYHNDSLTIWTPCQGVFVVRTMVADILSMPYHKVRVIKTPMGGSFGGKQFAVLEQIAAFASRDLHKPVLLQLDREESIISTVTRPDIFSNISSKVAEDGILLDTKIHCCLNSGAYASSALDYLGSLGTKVCRLYHIPSVEYDGQAIYTNTSITSGARGWGSPEFFTAMELHMDQIATELHLDPLELRLRNIVAPYTVDPYSGFNVGNAGIRECLLQGAEAIGWTHREPSADDRYRIGYGLACCAHKNGILGSFGGAPEYSSMILKMNDDGTLILNTGVHDMGCGTVLSMAKIVAEVLDVAPQNIQVLEGDTQAGPYDFGTYGSRVTYVSGACAYYAAMAMKKEMLETAAQLLAVEPEQLQLRAGQVVSVSDAHVCMNYQQLAARAMFTLNRDLLVKYSHIPSQNPSSYAAHFAKVMVDQYTGLVKVIDYVAAHDVGVAINPLMVEAQIQGGVQMGIGYALQEEIQYNRDGTNKTAGFRNYHLCNAPDMPDVRVVLVEKGEAGGPFGAKGVGEVATVPVAAAVVNAVNNALSSNLRDLPLTPEKIIAAINNDHQGIGEELGRAYTNAN